ncbi:dethiobiotin synthase [Aquisalimonas sp. 2447]|uniref:dethiobiotin synthase n=1 Tax=Aquisalimonas sp. 2447 TaxID=2740807 RepID=UPI0014327E60|nr:dethiobiotin synthase [Aquisalimonas sp. 2447]QIT56709.1 dethiobiotin synthase [Aquisalimonas sp. 2447]
MTGLFVTGTDTGVGKTVVGCALLAALADTGLRTVAMKPVASGCRHTSAGLRNEDAEALQATASVKVSYQQVNPVALEPAVAPHLAAARAGVEIDVSALAQAGRRLEADADLLLVEGAGGWRVPLGAATGFADLAQDLGYPVVLVVAIRLGCINHALLTAEAVQRDGLPLAGWVANVMDPDEPLQREQIASLQARLPAPCLGTLPPRPGASSAAMGALLDVGPLV